MAKAETDETAETFYGLIDNRTGKPVTLSRRHYGDDDNGGDSGEFLQLSDDETLPFYKVDAAYAIALTLEEDAPYYNTSEQTPGHGDYCRKTQFLSPARFTVTRSTTRNDDGRVTGYETTTSAKIVDIQLPKPNTTRGHMIDLSKSQAIALGAPGARRALAVDEKGVQEFRALAGEDIRLSGRRCELFKVIAVVEEKGVHLVALGEPRFLANDDGLQADEETSSPAP